jgi:hypothetical protein
MTIVIDDTPTPAPAPAKPEVHFAVPKAPPPKAKQALGTSKPIVIQDEVCIFILNPKSKPIVIQDEVCILILNPKSKPIVIQDEVCIFILNPKFL